MNAIEHHLPNADFYIIHPYAQQTKLLFEYLQAKLIWSRDGRSKTSPAYCNMGTDYLGSSGNFRIGQKFDPMVLKLMTRLNDELNVMMNSCFAMLYETEQAELPFRDHQTVSLDFDQPILTIFLGAPTKILFKDITNAEEFDFEILDSDLLILPDLCQKKYFNAIRKSDGAFSPRISLTFRRFNDGVFY